METRDKKHSRRVRNLIAIFALTAIMISVATYAWFIGNRTVNVSPFDIEIAGTDSLLLSLDGSKWDTTVAINHTNFDDDVTTVYAGHRNSWAGNGLKPTSSVGQMDVGASRLMLYEKGSMTATPGGYRIMASRYNNHIVNEGVLVDEPGGYVAFDLFVKNFSGREYYEDLDALDEEAIYLTAASNAAVSNNDAQITDPEKQIFGIGGTGVENSVRVAFAQIGRVRGTETDPAKITGITCNPIAGTEPDTFVVDPEVNGTNGSTGICREAVIWEPNDKAHVQGALNYYNTSCATRKNDATLPIKDAYNIDEEGIREACGTVAIDGYAPTYAINSVVGYGDKVDVYDGTAYNGYTSTKLTDMTPKYFTDTMKAVTGVGRQEIFTLSPNSITKVRVYVWIEGQDIDNYDFASIGKAVSVAFGFTKQRFNPGDEGIGYTGPDFPSGDTWKPVITLTGEKDITIAATDLATFDPMAGITVSDQIGEDTEQQPIMDLTNLTRKVQIEGTIDVNASAGQEFYLRYIVSDWNGNYADTLLRKITVN